MTKQIQTVSKCCKSTYRISDPNASRGQTVYWICDECKKPCDCIEVEQIQTVSIEMQDFINDLRMLLNSPLMPVELDPDIWINRLTELIADERQRVIDDVEKLTTNQLTPHGFESDDPNVENAIQNSKLKHLAKLITKLNQMKG